MKNRRRICLLLALLLLLPAAFGGCRPDPADPEELIQPFTFYYRREQIDHSSETGLIAPELRDLGDGTYTDFALFELYFAGPVSEDLISPVPKSAQLMDVTRSGTQISFRISQVFDTMSSVDGSPTSTLSTVVVVSL